MSADPSNAPSTALRTSRFSFREPALLFPRVRLYPGLLVLDGWHWHGRFCRQIPLGHILQVDVTSTGRLIFWLSSGETIRLRLDDAAAWKQAIERYQGARHAPIPS